MDPVTVGITAGSSLFNAFSQGAQNRKNRQFQAQENQKARDFELDMWNKNNAYNDPKEQMLRLKNAGISPHLAYQNGAPMNASQGQASSGASSTIPGQAPQLDPNLALQANLMSAQIDNIKADTEKKKVEATGGTINNSIAQNELDNWQTSYEARLEVQNASSASARSGIKVNESQINKNLSEVIKINAESDVLRQKIENLKSEQNLTDSQVKKIYVDMAVSRAQIQNILADTNLKNTTRSNLEADTSLKNQYVKSASMNNEILSKYGLMNADANYRGLEANVAQKLQAVETDFARKLNLDANTKNADFQLFKSEVLYPAEATQAYRDVFIPGLGGSNSKTPKMKTKR